MAEKKDEKEGTKHEDIRAGLESYWKSTQTLRDNTKSSFEFVVGGVRQWKADDISALTEQNRPVMSFNLCQDKVNFLSGYQAEREQDYRYFPRGAEDEQLGRLSTAIVKYSMDQAEGEFAQHQQFRRGIIGGNQIMEIGHSYEFTDDLVEGDLSLTVLPENSWACDTGARRYDRNDAKWQAKLMWFTKDEMDRRFPKKDGAAWTVGTGMWEGASADPRTTGVPDHYLVEYFDKATQRMRVIQYWYRKPIEIAILANLKTGEVQRFSSGKDAETYLKQMQDEYGAKAGSMYHIADTSEVVNLVNLETGQMRPMADHEAADNEIKNIRKQAGAQVASQYQIISRDATALRVAHCTAWEKIDDGPSPYLEDWRYPFSPFICYQDLDDYNSIKGIIEDIKDPQRELNWHYSTLLDVIIRGPKGGVWLDASMDNRLPKLKQDYSRPGFMGTFTGQPPIPVLPQIVPQADMDMIQFSLQEAMRITGLSAELLGQSTQKTISGRARQVTQAGALVGVASVLLNWQQTKKYQGQLLLKRIQQFYSVEKMMRIVGQNQQVAKAMGSLGQVVIPDEVLLEKFKQMKQTEMDCVVGFQEANPTARAAVSTQLLQLRAAGFPIPPEVIVESADLPFKEEIKAALKAQGMQPPDEMLAKVLGAGQGQGQSPAGVNKTQ